MYIMIFTDGDSAVYNPKTGEKLKESIWGSTYIIDIDPITFLTYWCSNQFKLSEKVYDILNTQYDRMVDCLLNNVEDKINYSTSNGNYYIKFLNDINLETI